MAGAAGAEHSPGRRVRHVHRRAERCAGGPGRLRGRAGSVEQHLHPADRGGGRGRGLLRGHHALPQAGHHPLPAGERPQLQDGRVPAGAADRREAGRGPGARVRHAAGHDAHPHAPVQRPRGAPERDPPGPAGRLPAGLGLLLPHLPHEGDRRRKVHGRRLCRQHAHRHGHRGRCGGDRCRGHPSPAGAPGVRLYALPEADSPAARPGRLHGLQPSAAAPQPPDGLLRHHEGLRALRRNPLHLHPGQRIENFRSCKALHPPDRALRRRL